MTIAMDKVNSIKDMYFNQHLSISKISEKCEIDWKTAKKYVLKSDFNEVQPTLAPIIGKRSKLLPFVETIDKWLLEDQKNHGKQRHTAKQIHKLLKEGFAGFDCSYELVARYVSKQRKAMMDKKTYLPLNHFPGEAQADFGSAKFVLNGEECDGKYLVLSFPASNAGFMVLNRGENLECLLEGLKYLFERLGGVPKEIWFDNASSMVGKVLKGSGRVLVKGFESFMLHYGFQAKFMNPASGHEKGNVENKVGYLRRNLLVPIPNISSLDAFNDFLFSKCLDDMKREHYLLNDSIESLFRRDKEALVELPSVPFETASYKVVMTDKNGVFSLNGGKHRYSTTPSMKQCKAVVKITSSEVAVYDENNVEIIRHKRLYGDFKTKSYNLIPYFSDIARKPRSLYNSGLYDMMPTILKKFFDSCETSQRSQVLKALSALVSANGFDKAVKAVERAVELNVYDADSIKSLFARIYLDVPQIEPIASDVFTPLGQILACPALESYDGLLKGAMP